MIVFFYIWIDNRLKFFVDFFCKIKSVSVYFILIFWFGGKNSCFVVDFIYFIVNFYVFDFVFWSFRLFFFFLLNIGKLNFCWFLEVKDWWGDGEFDLLFKYFMLLFLLFDWKILFFEKYLFIFIFFFESVGFFCGVKKLYFFIFDFLIEFL